MELFKAILLITALIPSLSCESLYDDAFNSTMDESVLVFSGDGNDGYDDEVWLFDGVNEPVRISDTNQIRVGENPGNFIAFQGRLYFTAEDGANGMELWVYQNGVSSRAISDINPNPSPNNNSFSMTRMKPIVYDNKLCFQATNGILNQLWIYDGINAPYQATDYDEVYNTTASDKIIYKGKVFFEGNINPSMDHDLELFYYDGENDVLEEDIKSGDPGSRPSDFCIYNDKLYFAADDDDAGTEKDLFVYDGITTSSVSAASSLRSISNLTVYNGKLYFAANDGTDGIELWMYDGSSVSQVSNLNVGGASSNPSYLTVYKSKLYFSANCDDGGLNDFGTELCIWDGSSVEIINIANAGTSSSPQYLTILKEKLYFSAGDDIGNVNIYSFDGQQHEVVIGSALVADPKYLYTWKRHTAVFK